jgi:hypothetical protein
LGQIGEYTVVSGDTLEDCVCFNSTVEAIMALMRTTVQCQRYLCRADPEDPGQHCHPGANYHHHADLDRDYQHTCDHSGCLADALTAI